MKKVFFCVLLCSDYLQLYLLSPYSSLMFSYISDSSFLCLTQSWYLGFVLGIFHCASEMVLFWFMFFPYSSVISEDHLCRSMLLKKFWRINGILVWQWISGVRILRWIHFLSLFFYRIFSELNSTEMHLLIVRGINLPAPPGMNLEGCVVFE